MSNIDNQDLANVRNLISYFKGNKQDDKATVIVLQDEIDSVERLLNAYEVSNACEEIIKMCRTLDCNQAHFDEHSQQVLNDIIAKNSVEYQDNFWKYYDELPNVTADDLFKKLGYTKLEGLYEISYQSKSGTISFNKVSKSVEVYKLEEKDFITMQELQAINNKCIELEWSCKKE